ncbi:MAG: epoxyqueuosine reductase [Coriobacteriia bacterium]|nr:epoxyqueuosine reductase [Coriobacteriia bacterium]
MDKQQIEDFVVAFVNSKDNRITLDFAREPELVGLRMFDEPLLAYGNAHDSRFVALADNPAAQVALRPPPEWLPSAQSVISCFLPVAADIRKGNHQGSEPSWGWMHARIEGNAAINALARQLCAHINQQGYEAICPAQDERYYHRRNADPAQPLFSTNWSERHVGYLCGLGTFSLSKGLITEKGVAGRIFSIITSLKLVPTKPKYEGLFDYCSGCRSCVGRCPVDAVSDYHLKDDRLCSNLLDVVLKQHGPYYGCGKCQVGVPCEEGIP